MKPRRRFVTDLAGLHAECEANYLRLNKLFPGWRDQESYEFAVDLTETVNAIVRITVTERNPYTSTLVICQEDILLPWASGPELTVRVYHDAKMAEVVAWNQHRNLHPRYTYPNEGMYHRDEKGQVNRFLAEWLKLCCKHGRVTELAFPF